MGEDEDKRLAGNSSPYHKEAWWEKHNDKRENLENEEERHQEEKRYYPEAVEDDWWDKRSDGMEYGHHGYEEKRNNLLTHPFQEKRPFSGNRIDELAKLLNYKKAVDFLSEEKRSRHEFQEENKNPHQRPFTQEEENELQNLASMDLQLQKIAEKLHENRRG
ncbi:UNVERIFIED_CONTAM: hypothetical protein FKN15_042576 [Acipenser sinensis]